jgi:hypothetical protein
MAEVTLGLLGAAATVGAAQLTTGSGFTGRHESSHREEMMETRRNVEEFRAILRGGDVTPDEESEFWETKSECGCIPPVTKLMLKLWYDRAILRENEYHESIESYKGVSWFNIPKKLNKRKDVRRGKRLTRQSNHTLRNLNEVRCYSRGKKVANKCEVDEFGL